MITPPANVEVLDNNTTPRENTGAKQLAGKSHAKKLEVHCGYIIIIPLAMETLVVICLGPAHVSMDTVMV